MARIDADCGGVMDAVRERCYTRGRYSNIGKDKIDYICDTTIDKINKYSPGKHIPIKSMNYFKKNKPNFVFLLGWNHKKEIFKKEKNFIKKNQWFSHINI